MAGHHERPVSPTPLADEESLSAAAARERFHYGIFHARGGRSFASVEILGTTPLPITHLETRDHLRVAGIKQHDASGSEIARSPAASFPFGLAPALSSKLARVAHLFRTRTFR